MLTADEDRDAAVALFAALAHPVRLRVLLLLDELDEASVSELQERTGAEQSALSHQLSTLRRARLVRGERVGRNVVYRLQDHHVAHIVRDALLHVRENDPS
jgi:DNA-binding transcriptional ArsR family regulator